MRQLTKEKDWAFDNLLTFRIILISDKKIFTIKQSKVGKVEILVTLDLIPKKNNSFIDLYCVRVNPLKYAIKSGLQVFNYG